MILREVMVVTQCDNVTLHVTVAGSTNSAERWI
jgi:hypothetical protein